MRRRLLSRQSLARKLRPHDSTAGPNGQGRLWADGMAFRRRRRIMTDALRGQGNTMWDAFMRPQLLFAILAIGLVACPGSPPGSLQETSNTSSAAPPAGSTPPASTAAATTPTYYRDVLPIVYAHCQA